MKRSRKKTAQLWQILLLLLLALAALWLIQDYGEGNAPSAAPAAPVATLAGELRAVFFDVGQADCVLLSVDGHNMLLDAGNVGQEELVKGYLAAYGVNKLDYLLATHPHADHIGAMAQVVYDMEEIGAVLMPEAIATTQVFEKLLSAIEERGLSITVPQAGDTFQLGQAAVTVLAPLSGAYEDMNDYSLVLRLNYGNTAMLFTGDAEKLSEDEQLASGRALKADLLKIPHHGSSSSSSQAYLEAVRPAFAVISCGKDNSYGHPHAETLAALQKEQISVYRTDELGTIEFVSDGQSIRKVEP